MHYLISQPYEKALQSSSVAEGDPEAQVHAAGKQQNQNSISLSDSEFSPTARPLSGIFGLGVYDKGELFFLGSR